METSRMQEMKPDRDGPLPGHRTSVPEPAWMALIVASVVAVLTVSVYCLMNGITIIFMHLFYFPIILLAYHYRYRGFWLATALSLAYVGLVYAFEGAQADVITGAWLRFLVFTCIAAVVAYLSEHIIRDETSIRESEKRYRSLFENMLEGFSYCRMIYDEKGKPADWIYLDVNAAFEPMTGLKDVVGKRVLEVIPDIRHLTPGLFETYGRVATTGVPEVFEIDFLPLKRFYKVSVFSPEQGYFVTVFEDITERNRVERALRVNEERLSLALEATSDGLWDWDIARNRIYWSPRAYQMLGYAPDAFPITFEAWKDLIHPDDRKATKTALDIQLKEGNPFSAEFRYRMKDGSWKWVLGRGRVVAWDAQGRVDRMVGTHVDLSWKKQTEEELRDSEEKFRQLFHNASDAIFLHDIAPNRMPGRFVEVNETACAVLGYSREELLNMTVADINTSQDKENAPAIVEELVRTGHARFEGFHTRRDGTVFPVEISAHYIHIQGHWMVLSVCRDITERRRAEKAFIEINRKLNLLSSITRHDINNQLFSLKAFLELMKDSLEDSAQTAKYLLKAERAAEAIERQIAFTKEYQDLGITAPVWQEVAACVKDAAGSLPLGEIRLVTEANKWEVYADPLLAKVFYNLIDNALRYGGEKMTEIRVSAQEAAGKLVIAVEDDGDGITHNDKMQLFSKGFGHNTGLGLFLSKDILAITGMSITENGEPGKGARFEITVPEGAWRHTPAPSSAV